jgi:hypothetical protein
MGEMRCVFEGSIEVDATGYFKSADYDTADFDDGDGLVPIDDVEVPFTPLAELTFVLDYPFEQPLDCVVRSNGGIALRHVIDAVRAGFHRMYENATEEDIPNLANKRVTGAYGVALHIMGDLVIESIDLDESEGRLEIGIGS